MNFDGLKMFVCSQILKKVYILLSVNIDSATTGVKIIFENECVCPKTARWRRREKCKKAKTENVSQE